MREHRSFLSLITVTTAQGSKRYFSRANQRLYPHTMELAHQYAIPPEDQDQPGQESF